MMRWFVGFYLIWISGLTIKCIISYDCVRSISLENIMLAVNGKSVLVKGTISSIVVLFIAAIKNKSR